MKSKILSLLGVGAIAMAVACNNSSDETTNADTSSVTTSENTTSTSSSTVQTSADGKKYVLRTRTSSTGTDNAVDTVWLQMGSQDRWYVLSGPSDRDTLYFDTDEWKAWWSNPETDNELKSKSNGTKVKIDDDGSWKVKDDTSKTKMNEKGKVKTKPKG